MTYSRIGKLKTANTLLTVAVVLLIALAVFQGWAISTLLDVSNDADVLVSQEVAELLYNCK